MITLDRLAVVVEERTSSAAVESFPLVGAVAVR